MTSHSPSANEERACWFHLPDHRPPFPTSGPAVTTAPTTPGQGPPEATPSECSLYFKKRTFITFVFPFYNSFTATPSKAQTYLQTHREHNDCCWPGTRRRPHCESHTHGRAFLRAPGPLCQGSLCQAQSLLPHDRHTG